MPKTRKKNWSVNLEEAGVRIRVYERTGSSSIWCSVIRDGQKHRKSLKTSNRKLAEERAEAIARSLAELELTGGAIENITLRQLSQLYLHHRGPLLTKVRRRHMKLVLGLVVEHFGPEYLVDDFSQHALDSYVSARQRGSLRSADWRASKAPAAGTIRNELHSFSVICNWATEFKVRRQALLARNPVRKLKIPQEPNPRRPLVTEARYKALLSVADQADAEGRLRVLLTLAWETGRRINAILHLRASDVLLTEDQVLRRLAEEGQDESLAEYWPRALRWRAEFDKCKYLDFSPLPEGARVPLEAYLRRHPVVGEAWLFPANRNPSHALDKLMAGYYLVRAEKLAGLPHQKRGGWHAFRRAWATRRKALPVQDVMRAGGWRDVKALQSAYQSADPETVRRVLDMA